MPANMDIMAQDYKVWDFQHTVTYKVRAAADNFTTTTVSGVKAVREDIENRLEDDVSVRRAVWHVPNTLISAITPKTGDKITDADNADWYIEFADRDPSGHYWLFRTVKGVS